MGVVPPLPPVSRRAWLTPGASLMLLLAVVSCVLVQTGACLKADKTCAVLAPQTCMNAGGVYFGNGFTCAAMGGTLPPPGGGMCYIEGPYCFGVTSESYCVEEIGGSFSGAGNWIAGVAFWPPPGGDGEVWTTESVQMMTNSAQSSVMWQVAIVFFIGVWLGWVVLGELKREGAGTWSLKRGGL